MSDGLPNLLREMHGLTEAEFQGYADVEIVTTFGQPEAEYAAIRKGAGLMDLPQRGVLELTGKDRLSFLNNLLTNQTWDKKTKTGLAAGSGVYAYFLNTKGRIVADMNVIERGERTLLEMDARMVEVMKGALEKFVFSEQVTMRSKVGEVHRMSLHGPEGIKVLRDAGAEMGELGQMESAEVNLFGVATTVFRDDECATAGYHLIVPAERAGELWTKLMVTFSNPLELGKRRLRAIGWAAYNAARIEGGRPIFDIDFGNSANVEQSVLPAEAGQFERAVSVVKGCYLGQEVVARMHARQQVAKQLVGLRVADGALPLSGNPIVDAADNVVGMVTSSTVSPVMSNAAIALGYLKRPHFAVGTKLRVAAEGAMREVEVVERPFIKAEG